MKKQNKNKSNTCLIFTYGTLMQNNHNNHILGNAKYICDATISNHICFGLPYDFPMVINVGVEIDNYVVGEIWEVEINQLSQLDMLEGYNKYEDNGMYLRREIIATDTNGKDYKCYYYLWNSTIVKDSYIVPSGVKWNGEHNY